MTSCSASHADVTSQLESCTLRPDAGAAAAARHTVTAAGSGKCGCKHKRVKQMQQRNDFSSLLSKSVSNFPPSIVLVSFKRDLGLTALRPCNGFCLLCITGICSTSSFAFSSLVCMFVLLQSCLRLRHLHMAHVPSSDTVPFRQATRTVHDVTPQMILRIKINLFRRCHTETRLPDTFQPLGGDHSLIQRICFCTEQKL